MTFKIVNRKVGKNISVLAAILMFVIIYHPPIMSINILYVLTPLVWIYVLIHRKTILKGLNKRLFRTLCCWIFVMIIYQTIISLLHGHSPIQTSVGMLWWLISVIPSSVVIRYIINLREEKENCFFNTLCVVAIVQFLLCALAYAFPSVQLLFLSKLDYAEKFYSYRLYGFAAYLTGFTAMTQGVLASIFFCLGMTKSKKFYAVAILALFVGVVNARTSIVIFAASMVFVIAFSKMKTIRKVIIGVALVIIAVVGLGELESFRYSDNETIKWIILGIDQIFSLFKGEKVDYFLYLSNAKVRTLPIGRDLIFGIGQKVFDYTTGFSFKSDIGYVNDLWTGGIFFCSLFYLFFLVLLFKVYAIMKQNCSTLQCVSFILLVAVLLSNFKGIINTDNDLISLMFIITIFYMNKNQKQECCQIISTLEE